MSLSNPSCPSCGGSLVLTHQGSLDSWVCPSGHGLALTLSESYERLQEDEITKLWDAARRAEPVGEARRSPTTGAPMVSVKVSWDGDEAPEGETGDTPEAGSVWLDVDVWDQVIWFDASELEPLPQDLPDAGVAPAEAEALAKIRATFGASVESALESRDDHEVAERIYQRMARHSGLVRVLSGVGSLGRS